jgi:hypothetical protein
MIGGCSAARLTTRYVNPPSSPVWGLDAPSDRNKTYLPLFHVYPEKDSLYYTDKPTTEKILESLGKNYFPRHCVEYATSETYFRTLIEYKGKVRAQVEWFSSSNWLAGTPTYPTPR